MVNAQMEKVQGLVDTAKDISSQGNFLAEKIQQRVLEVVNRVDEEAGESGGHDSSSE